MALTALAIAVFAPLPYVTTSLSELVADESELALNYVNRPAWVRAFFYAHIVVGGLALLLSPVQLSARIRARAPRLHRMSGRIVLTAIMAGGVAVHRQWMLRAFALTYAAVTLRLWLGVLVPIVGDFRAAYLLVPFLAWVPNLLVVEWLLRRRPAGDRSRTPVG